MSAAAVLEPMPLLDADKLADVIRLFDPRHRSPIPERLRVIIYARISLDKRGLQLGTERQVFNCQNYSAMHKFDVVGVYIDNDAPALRQGRRPEWDKALAHLARGGVDAMVVQHSDRLSRNSKDADSIIDLNNVVDSRGLAVYTVDASKFDLATPMGRFMFKLSINLAQLDSEEKGIKVRNEQVQRARRRIPPAMPRPYGWTDGKLTEQRADEAARIRDMYEWALSGVTLGAIARRLNDAGVPTAGRTVRDEHGNAVVVYSAWTHHSVKHILEAPRQAGYLKGKDDEGEAVLLRGTFPPIVDLDTWQAMQELLKDPARHGNVSGKAEKVPRLLTGLAYTEDGEPLRGRKEAHTWASGQTVRYYGTAVSRGVQVRQTDLDALVVKRLFDEVDRGGLAATDVDNEQAEQLRSTIAEAERMLAKLKADRKAHRLDYDDFVELSQEHREQRDAAKERLRSVTVKHDEITELLRAPGALAAAWDDLTFHQQRDVLARCIERIVVAPGTTRGPRARLIYHPERVKVTFKRARRRKR